MTLSDEERVARYLNRNPDASLPEIAGALWLDPGRARVLLQDVAGGKNASGCDFTTTVSARDEEVPPRGEASGEWDAPHSAGESDAAPPTTSEHYARLGDLYATLGEIDGWHCPGNRDFYGWYRTRQGPGAWDGEGRAWALGNEFAGIRQELERVVYATVNYVPAKWFMDSWHPFNYEENGREWKGDKKPTPGYGDIHAYAPFADIDLTDAAKRKRPDGDAPRETVETALTVYLEAFGELAGSMEHVYALDSVGGAYAFVAPTATAPIADAFDRQDRAIIFEDMTDRLNDWLDGVKDDVNAAVPDAAGTFEPDLLNNKNRLYKAPMSIHSSLDGVVTPLDPENPSYDYTPIEAVDDDAIADAEAWADGFTSDHTDAVSAVVANLWPDSYADADGWRDAVSARIDELREGREAHRERTRQRPSVDDLPDDIEETDDIDVVTAAIEAIDCRDVARDVAAEWDTAPGRDPPRFDPPWRSSDSGTSCYADREKFVDLEEGKKGGGPLTLVARASGILTSCRDRLRGDDYLKSISQLRNLGYDIPLLKGDRLPENASPYYSVDLVGIADDHGVSGDPYDDDMTLLKACLAARDDIPGLADETPPYAALVAVAEWADLSMSNPDDGILGKTAHRYAREIYAELSRDDLNTPPAAGH